MVNVTMRHPRKCGSTMGMRRNTRVLPRCTRNEIVAIAKDIVLVGVEVPEVVVVAIWERYPGFVPAEPPPKGGACDILLSSDGGD